MQVITNEKKQLKYFFAVGECPEVDRVVPQKKSEHYFIKSKCLQYETNAEIFKYGIGVHVYLSIFDEGFFYFYFKASKEYTRLSMETAAKTLQIVQFLMPIHVNSAA